MPHTIPQNIINYQNSINIVQTCHGASQHCTVAARHDHYNFEL